MTHHDQRGQLSVLTAQRRTVRRGRRRRANGVAPRGERDRLGRWRTSQGRFPGRPAGGGSTVSAVIGFTCVDRGHRCRRRTDHHHLIVERRESGDGGAIEIVEHPDRTVVAHGAQLIPCLSGDDDDETAVDEFGPPLGAELPVGCTDLRIGERGQRTGLARSGRPASKVPPAGLVGREHQVTVVCPISAVNRRPVATGHEYLVAEPCVVEQGGCTQLGPIPGHVRVIPPEPTEPATVGGDPGTGDEIGAAGQDFQSVAISNGRPVGRHGNDHVERFAPVGFDGFRLVVLHHTDHPFAVRRFAAVGEPKTMMNPRRGCDRRRRGVSLGPGGEAIDALVVPVGEVDRCWPCGGRVTEPPSPSTVFVGTGSGVEPRIEAIQPVANQRRPTALGRPQLAPPHLSGVAATSGRGPVDSHRPFGDADRRQWRGP